MYFFIIILYCIGKMTTPESNIPVAQDHYAYVTRSAIRLFNQGVLTNVRSIDVEPEYGYTTRLTYDDGSHRITYGNDLGLNSGAACDLAKDKGHTKFMLRKIGVNCPDGKEFLLPWWADEIGPSQTKRGNTGMRTTDEATDYIESQLGYPAYIKPVSGSKGLGVHRVDTAAEADDVFDAFEESRERVAVVEKAIKMPDYRVVVLDGKLISAYERKPLAVTGNGKDSILALIEALQEEYTAQGRDTIINMEDPRIAQQLGKLGLTFESVVEADRACVLTSISNLSAGGTSVEISDILHDRWVNTAAYIAENFNLRLCGVDLACADITDPNSDYSILEVNAAPGLDHYASSGENQQRIVDRLYTQVLNTYPLKPVT
jgi:D-alanine-D-alanine ligase-like ATP-grasp enzyme